MLGTQHDTPTPTQQDTLPMEPSSIPKGIKCHHIEIRERKHMQELGGLPSLAIKEKLPLYPESGKTKKSLGNEELSWPARDVALISQNTSRDQVIKSGVNWFEICEDRHLRASATMYLLPYWSLECSKDLSSFSKYIFPPSRRKKQLPHFKL